MLLCSDDVLGLGEHPRVREAAAEAALRWGAGPVTTPLHRRLEDELARFHRTEAAHLGASVDGAIEAISSRDGSIAALGEHSGSRLVVDESNAVGALGPGGRGAAAEEGIADAVLVGSLGHALGSAGDYVACDSATGPRLIARTLPPPQVAAALVALRLLQDEPARMHSLAANAGVLHDELAREGFDVAGCCTHIVSLPAGDEPAARAMAEAALAQGVSVRIQGDCLRLSVTALHSRAELTEAAHVLGRSALRAGLRPATMVPGGGEVVPLRRAA
jgi:glycine C-acetyltransferase/8-amino-7-oxononanoate synthase